MAKFSFSVLLSFYLISCQFQPGVAYKSVTYKKRVFHYRISRDLFVCFISSIQISRPKHYSKRCMRASYIIHWTVNIKFYSYVNEEAKDF